MAEKTNGPQYFHAARIIRTKFSQAPDHVGLRNSEFTISGERPDVAGGLGAGARGGRIRAGCRHDHAAHFEAHAPDAVLVAIELNQDFVDFLRREVDDPRLVVLCGSASYARKLLASVGFRRRTT